MSLLEVVALGYENLFYHAVVLGGDVVLHLHSFQHSHFLASLHAIAHLHAYLNDFTGQGCSHHLAAHLLHGSCGNLFFLLSHGSLGRLGSSPTLLLNLGKVVFCHCGEEFEQEFFFLVLSEFHATCFFQYGVRLVLVFGGIIGDRLPCTCDLQTEFGIDFHGRTTILTLHQIHKLIGSGGIFGFACGQRDCTAYCLRANDLACGGYQRGQTCVQPHGGDKFHCGLQEVLAFECLQLCHHVGVHTAGDFGFLHEFVGFGESEVLLNLVTSVDKGLLVHCIGSLHGPIELSINLCGNGVGQRVERIGELFYCIVCLQLLADTE